MVAAIILIRLFVYKPFPVFLSFLDHKLFVARTLDKKVFKKWAMTVLGPCALLLNDYFQLYLLDSPMIQGCVKWRR